MVGPTPETPAPEPAPPPAPRRRHRAPVIVLSILLGAIALVVLAFVLLMVTPPGRALVARLATDAAAAGGVAIEGLELDGPFAPHLRARRIAVADGNGPWLTLRGVSADWSPAALLSGRLEIDRLAAERATVERLPAAEPQPAPPPGQELLPSLPRLPIDVRLDRLAVARLELAAPVTGVPIAATAEGSAGLDDARLALTLHARSLEPDASRLDIDARLDRAAGRLALDIGADDPGSGPVAAALGLPDRPPVRLRIQGDGPIDGWQGEATLDSGTGLSARLALGVAHKAEWAFTVKGDVRSAALLEGPLGERLAIDAAATVGDKEARLDRLSLSGAGVRLAASGTLDRAQSTLRATVDLTLDNGTALAPWLGDAAIGPAEVHVSASGAADRPSLDGTFSLLGVRADRVAVERAAGSLKAGPTAGGWHAETVARLDGIAPDDPKLAALLGPWLTISASADAPAHGRPALPTLAVEGEHVAFGGKIAPADPSGWRFDLAIGRIDVAALAGYLGGKPAEAAGTLSGTLAGTLAGDGAVEARLEASGADARFGLASAADRLLGTAPTLAADIRRGADGALRLDDLALAGANGRLSGHVALSPGGERAEGSIRLQAPSLAALEPGMKGAADLTAAISGPSADPAVKLTGTVEGFAIGGTDLGRLTLDLDGDRIASGPAGRLALRAQTRQGTVAASAAWAAPGWNELRLSGLEVTRRGDRLAGDLTLPFDGRPPAGRLRATADLAGWSALIGTSLAGKLRADATLGAPANARARGAGDLVADIRIDGFQAGATTVARSVEARITASGLPAAPAGRFSVDIAGLRAGKTRMPQLALAGTVTLPSGAGKATTLVLERLDGRLDRTPIRLESPARLVRGPNELSADIAGLAIGTGRVELAARVAGKQGTLRLRARALPLAVLGLRDGVTGAVDADADLSGPAESLTGPLDLAVRDIKGLPAGAGRPTVRVAGRLTGARAELSAELSGLSGQPLRGTGSMPLRISLAAPGVNVDEAGPISAQVSWTGPIGPLAALAPGADENRLQGNGSIELSVAGTLARPDISGRIALAGGRYENLSFGTVLTPVEASLVGSGSRWRIERFTARDGGSGTLTATGEVDLGDGGRPTGRIDVRLDHARLVRRDDATATISGNIAAVLEAETGRITGRLVAQPVDVTLAGGLPANVATLPVTDINRPGQRPAPRTPPEPTAPALPIALDIQVSVPAQMHIHGRGLTSEWSGSFSVTGTLEKPVAVGDLKPVRGQYEFAGKVFELQQGSVIINPEETGRSEPVLDLSAVYTATDITATVKITGPASHPEIKLSSTPELPQDEILSRVMFGKTTGQLTAGQAVALAQSVASLSGIEAGGGILDRLRTGLGLDVLGFTPGAGSGGIGAARAGTYLTEGVFVGVEQGTTPGSTAASVEVEITPHISVQSSSNAQGGTKAGVIWRYDY